MYLTLVFVYCRLCCKNSPEADTAMFDLVSITVAISDGMRRWNDYSTVVWELSGRKNVFQCNLHEVCMRERDIMKTLPCTFYP